MLLALFSFAHAGPVPLQFDLSVGGTIYPTVERSELTESGADFGVRVGYAVQPWLVPYVGATFGGGGMDHYFENDDAYVDDYASTFRSAYVEDQFLAGVKFAWQPNRYFGLYGRAQGQLVYGDIRIDDDLDTDDNPGQLEYSGLSGGATGVLGLEAAAPVAADVFAVTFHLEGGYTWNAPLHLGDVAALDLQGAVIRAGIGARF